MKETKYERGKPGREKRKSTRVNLLLSAWTLYYTCRNLMRPFVVKENN